MACFAPKARANCVTALPIDPPTAGAKTVLPARKPARVSATCATHVVDIVRNQAKVFLPYGNPLTIGSILKSAIGAEEHHARSDRKVLCASLLHNARSF